MMIRIREKNSEIEVGSENELFYSFDLYWRNLKGECYQDDRCIDIMVKEIILKPSNKRVKTLNRDCTPVTLKSFHAFLNSNGVQWYPGNRIYYRDDENDVIPIDSESEYEEALKFLISHNEKTKENVMLIIEGDIHKTDHGLINMRTSAQPKVPVISSASINTVTIDASHQSAGKNMNKSRHRETKSSTPIINVGSDSPQNQAFEWFQKYMDNYKKEIVDDVVKIIEKKLSTAFGNLRDDNVNPVHKSPAMSSRCMNDGAEFYDYLQSLRESMENHSLSPVYVLPKQRGNRKSQPSKNYSAKSNDSAKKNDKKKPKAQKDLFKMNNKEICRDRNIWAVKSEDNVRRSIKFNSMVDTNRKSKMSKVKSDGKKILTKNNKDDDVNEIINKSAKLTVQDDTNIDLAMINEKAMKVSDNISEDEKCSLDFDLISLYTSSDTEGSDSSVERKHSLINILSEDLSDGNPEHQIKNESAQDPILIVESSNIDEEENMEEFIAPELNKRAGGEYSFVSSALLCTSSNERIPSETSIKNNDNNEKSSENKEHCDVPSAKKKQTSGNRQASNYTNRSRSSRVNLNETVNSSTNESKIHGGGSSYRRQRYDVLNPYNYQVNNDLNYRRQHLRPETSTTTSRNTIRDAKSYFKHRNSRFSHEYSDFSMNNCYLRHNNVPNVSRFNQNFMNSAMVGALDAASEAYSVAREVIEKINMSSKAKK